MTKEDNKNVTDFLRKRKASEKDVQEATESEEATIRVLAQYTNYHPLFVVWGYWRDL